MDSDEEICLSEHTLAALNEFYLEKQKCTTTVGAVEEDWELSQFWYDKSTAVTLANIALKASGKEKKIACISCPTVYTYILDICEESNNVYLFEYDKRFQGLYQEHFIQYDYNKPLEIPEIFKSYFDVVLVDPPYLSEECLEKTLLTVKYITKGKIILCTGAVMEELAHKMLSLKPCYFKPQHERKLGNEFKCFANWNLDALISEINVNTDY